MAAVTQRLNSMKISMKIMFLLMPVIPHDPVAIGPSCLLFNLYRFCAPEFGAECFKKESL